MNDIDFFKWPIIVKPVDSAGSKGVTRVNTPEQLPQAIAEALNFSQKKCFIIEDFLEFKGYHSSTDPFTIDGELVFSCFSDQLFDPEANNPYTPARIIWPSSMEMKYQNELTNDIQRLLKLLGAKTGIYNIESCVSTDGIPYIMEVSPRGGGCKIAELQKMAYGINLIKDEVAKAIGLPVSRKEASQCDGHWCEMVIHALAGKSGKLKHISIDPAIRQKHVKLIDSFAKPGDIVHPFTGANMALGDMFLRFDSREELNDVTNNCQEWLKIELE